MDIDKPLDDIIKENRIGKRAPKGRGGKAAKRGGRGGKAAVSAPAAALRRNLAKKAATRGKGKTAAAPRTVVKTEILRIKNEIKSKKLLVTNLAATVTQKDFQELFRDYGLVKAQLHFGPNGKPIGSGLAELKTVEKAERAKEFFHGRKLDGQALNVQLVAPPAEKRKPSIEDRLGPAPGKGAASKRGGVAGGRGRGQARGAKGRGRGRGRGLGRA